MANTNDLLNRINKNYSKMSKGQKLLATYITDNYDKALPTSSSLSSLHIVSGTHLTGKSLIHCPYF